MSTESREKEQNVSLSSISTQRQFRIDKMNELKKLGFNPFSAKSKRDFNLRFIQFWFDFVHKFDISKVENALGPNSLEFFLFQVLIPKDLVEKAEERLKARNMIRDLGFDPDSDYFEQNFDMNLVAEARNCFHNLSSYSEDERLLLLDQYLTFNEEKNIYQVSLQAGQMVTLAGRIKSKRVSGKIAFLTLEDESNPNGFQVVLMTNNLPETSNPQNGVSFEDFRHLLEEGDYVQVSGKMDYTKSGQGSLFVSFITILTKALRPLPEKMEAEDLEARYLNRVVDFKMNTVDKNGLSIRDLVVKKSNYWQIWREEMLDLGFLEVETPVFEDTPGGADARPFVTHYNELNQDVFLRISPELHLKRLIAGGFEKVFEIGRIFRNEGASPQHLQEYTQIEWYWAYADYTDAMPIIQRIYQRIVKETLGTLEQTDYYGNQINWGSWCSEELAKEKGWRLFNSWPMIPYYDAVRYFSNGKVDIEGKNYDELMQIAKDNNVVIEASAGLTKLVDTIYKKTARVNMIHPFFLVLPPVEMEPLAKRSEEFPELTERYQVVAGTAELGKGFSELNDPLDQLERFESQQAARDAGDEEAQFLDEDFVEALEYATPPMTGFGVSERFFSFILGKPIKECVTFPAVRSLKEKIDVNKVAEDLEFLSSKDKLESLSKEELANLVQKLKGLK